MYGFNVVRWLLIARYCQLGIAVAQRPELWIMGAWSCAWKELFVDIV